MPERPYVGFVYILVPLFFGVWALFGSIPNPENPDLFWATFAIAEVAIVTLIVLASTYKVWPKK